MFVQTEETPNPNTLKFLPGKIVSEIGPVEFKDKKSTNNELIRNLLSVNGVNMVFLGNNFITIKKKDELVWDDLKHIIISLINDFYLNGNKCVMDKSNATEKKEFSDNEIVNKINEILDKKIRPAVAKDGGDIKFVSFEKGVVKVELRGSCSGCPSSIMTLKKGVQNLLKHYVKGVNSVESI